VGDFGDQILRVKVVIAAIGLIALLGLFATVRLVFGSLAKRAFTPFDRWFIALALSANAVWLGCFAYGVLWEADWVEVTHEVVETAGFPSNSRYRIVHITDLHVDAPTDALDRLPALVNAEAPDLVVFTGDALNSAEGLPIFRRVLGAFRARDGVLAVKGNHDVWYWQDLPLFDGVATELRGRAVTRGPLVACGAAYGVTAAIEPCLRENKGKFRLLAYHTPDLAESFGDAAPDLYLAGHTHGGQVRIPFYGAVITFSTFDKRYEGGRYDVDGTTLYVNRGLGFESGAPRVRFLCRPEVTVIDLVGTGAPAATTP